jgi:hypothetical protein
MPIFLQQLAEYLVNIPNPDPKKWSFLQSWSNISCLQTKRYPPHGSDKWCFNVILAPGACGVRPCQFFYSSSWLKNWHTSSILTQKVIPFVASRPLDILHMGLISDVEVWYRLLLAWWCQAMSISTLVVQKLALAHIRYPLIQKVIPFAVMKPYQLPPDHWISSTLVR